MYTRWIGVGSAWLLARIVAAMAATGVHPNHLTLLGLAANIGAAVFFARGEVQWAAAMIFLAGFLDIADGQVARKQGRVTAFGAFFDSTVDRYSDMVLYLGLLILYAKMGRTLYVVLATVAMVGSFMVSYSRARAENVIPTCKVGFMERPERVVLLILGGIFDRMAPALWVIAVLTTTTVIHRIAFTWRETQAGRTLPALKSRP